MTLVIVLRILTKIEQIKLITIMNNIQENKSHLFGSNTNLAHYLYNHTIY